MAVQSRSKTYVTLKKSLHQILTKFLFWLILEMLKHIATTLQNYKSIFFSLNLKVAISSLKLFPFSLDKTKNIKRLHSLRAIYKNIKINRSSCP